jgi:hypothetical protein
MFLPLILAACSPDYALSLHAGPAEPGPAADPAAVPDVGATDARAARAAPNVAPKVSPRFQRVPIDVGSAVEAEVDPSSGERRETFELGGGAATPVADFLFVVDDSASMAKVIDRVRAAFASLGDAFPAQARVAVMSTLPGDPDDLTKVNAAARHPSRNRHAPGFLRLVNKTSITDFAKFAPENERARFPDPGCDEPWFSPTAVGASGVPCLVSHTQVAMDPVLVEAGLTAFGQLLEKRGDVPLFRPGAAANVIFVSDTQDPGLAPGSPGLDELVAARPDFARLSDLVDVANTVSSFRVHAIAPETECSERWSHIGAVYQAAAKASGGRTLDVCTADDYGAFIRAIAKDGAVVQRPVVALGRPLADDAVVEVDGQRVGWSPSADGRAITLDAIPGEARAHVTVTYRPKAAAAAAAAKKTAPATKAATPNAAVRPAALRRR